MMDFEKERPNPDKLLQEIQKDNAKSKKGKLKIFFGMCAGVGKTYAMLKMAQDDKTNGIDIVIGYIETHDRKETQALVQGFEIIPRKKIEHKGVFIEEMSIDDILNRKPQIVLVDELAHTNAPNSRHHKRYQDVLELIDNGISVYTTVNVQHLESRSDTVSQITGIIIHETVPDSILDKADEIEIIDLSPEDLLKRLAEGKVYSLERSKLATENFFRKGNLTALREMALRLTAERVDQELRDYMQTKKIAGTWKSGHRLMVAIGPSPYSAQLIRWSRRISYTMEAQWIAVSVETSKKLSEKAQDRLNKNIKLAQKLGAEVLTTNGEDLVEALLRIAHQENVTQIVLGKPRRALPFMGNRSLVNRLINESGEIDIYVVGGDVKQSDLKFDYTFKNYQSKPENYLTSIAIISTVALICYSLENIIGYQAVSLLLLLTVSCLPLFLGFGPVLLASALSALLWNFLFIPPKFTFFIAKLEDLLLFGMYFTIAITTGVLTTRIKAHEAIVKHREERTRALYNLTKELSVATTLDEVISAAIKNIKKFFDTDTILIPVKGNGKLSAEPHPLSSITLDEKEYSVATWVFKNKQKAGKYTTTLPSASAQYYPVSTARLNVGILGIRNKESRKFTTEQETFLETFIYQIASAMEREILNEKAKESMVISESERLYKTLFNSISHELRTPIATIMGASSLLLDENTIVETSAKKELSEEIYSASERLNRLVGNLLDMSRLESGTLKLNLDWHDVNDLINKVLSELKEKTKNHLISLELNPELPLIKIDFVLLEQAILNIISNSINYTPEGSTIIIKTTHEKDEVIIIISDNGTGLPNKELDKIFDKFYRVAGVKTGGTGLGLSIVKGFIEAHKGKITVENRETGGLRFIIKLKVEKEQMVINKND